VNIDWYLISAEIILAAYGVGLLVIGMLLPADQRKGVGPVTGWFLIGFLIYLMTMFNVDDVFMGIYHIDPFATFMKIALVIAAVIVVFTSNDWIVKQGNQPEYYSLVIFATLGMFAMASAGDLITAYIGIEMMTLAFVILAGFKKGDGYSAESGMKYLVLGAMSSAIILYGLTLIYGSTQSLLIVDIAGVVATKGVEPVMLLGIILLIASFSFKNALIPFHMWAPDVHGGAPTPVTALLTSTSIKAAGFAIFIRFFVIGFAGTWEVWGGMLIALSILTLVVGNLIALSQTNLKRMLAYSSVSHGGYVILGLIAYTELGITAILYYSLVYVFANAGAFIVVSVIERSTGGSKEISDVSGLAVRSPWLATLMMFFLASLAGLPPTAGFMGKFFLFTSVIEQGMAWLIVIALVMTIVSLYYYLRVIKTMFWGEPPSDTAVPMSNSVNATLTICMLFVILLGVYPALVYDWAAIAVKAFMPF